MLRSAPSNLYLNTPAGLRRPSESVGRLIYAMAETVVLRVGMSCQGCVGAVKRVLGKMEGVESFDVDLKEQKVTVKGNVTPDAVLQTVSKTGKKTSFWEAEPETKETAPAAAAAASTAPAAAAAASTAAA
ncbi:copper transport protein ATX1 [Elaeis guineensis]|uniref:Copper transport protein ATX1 isoform X3 n=1 Tax=Elaeis guineensis var. tenera TaxID=51953 RepID=A0A6I9QN72_ELAGV|nr:copper transport protein ATX1 isoform X3 [Elaeis guineensis]